MCYDSAIELSSDFFTQEVKRLRLSDAPVSDVGNLLEELHIILHLDRPVFLEEPIVAFRCNHREVAVCERDDCATAPPIAFVECEVTKRHSTFKDHERYKIVNVFQSFAIFFNLLSHLCYAELLVLILQGLLLTVDSAGFDQVKLFDLFVELLFEMFFLIFEDTNVRICNEELALPRQANVEGEPLLSDSEEHLLLFHKHDGAHLENFDQVAHPKV